MKQNRVKKIGREGGLAIGMYSGTLASPSVVEIIGYSGFDAAYLDMEHTALSLPEIQNMILAAEKHDITPIVRIPSFDSALIARLLDIGAQGIYVPHVSDAETAREAVRAVRYAPIGDRGVMPSCRAAEFGRVPLKQHIEESNREILLAVMIEDEQGVDQIDNIVAVDGVDLVAVGPGDLAISLGLGDAADHPRLVECMNRVAAAVAKRPHVQLAIPITAFFPRSARELKEMGVSFINLAPIPENRLRRALTDELAGIRGSLA